MAIQILNEQATQKEQRLKINENFQNLDSEIKLKASTSKVDDLAEDVDSLKTYVDNSVAGIISIPTGIISMWSGAINNIPIGWALCNGANGTPDLRGRFIVGAGGAYAVGATGGADTVALTTAQMPSHNHTLSGTVGSAGAHNHSIKGYRESLGGQTYYDIGAWDTLLSQMIVTQETSSSGAHTHTLSGTIGNTGSNSAHENRPPYFALCYIMKL